MVFGQGIVLKYVFAVFVWKTIQVWCQESCQISGLESPVRFLFTDCLNTEYGWNHNCNLTLSCETGSMPIFPIPLLDYKGSQSLLCVNGTWMTAFNTIANPLRCAEGCIPRNYTIQVVNDRQIFTYYDIDDQKSYNAQCQTSVLTTREAIETINPGIIPYYCPLTDADVDASGCENMCAMTYRIPNGNKIIKPFVEVNDDMFMFTFGGMEMIVGCQDGYEYARSSSHHLSGQQVIVCDGATGKLVDNVTRTETQINGCVEKPMCPELTLNSNVEMIPENSQCVPNTDHLPDGCVRAYYCREGSHPTDSIYLYNGTQRVRCDNSQWFDQRNRTITTSLTCANGCVSLDYTSLISYLTSHEYSIEYTELDVNGFKIMCLTSESQTTVSQIIQNMRNHNNPYFCQDTRFDNNTYVVIESLCQNSCTAINTTFLPEGLEAINSPPSIDVLDHAIVASNTSYDFRCRDGYRYIDTDVRRIGVQRFTCLESGGYLDSIRNSVFDSKHVLVYLCEKVPSCSLEQWTSDSSTIVFNSTCSFDQITADCMAEITCSDGFFPSLDKYQTIRSIRKVCRVSSEEVAQWVDVVTGVTVHDYRCIPGCVPRPVVNSTFNFGGFEIICSVSSTANENLFYCNSIVNQTTERGCTHTCAPLQGANTLIRTNLYTTLILDRFVVQNDGFRFACPSGLVFSDSQTNSKEFRCNGNQAYIDMSTNSTSTYVADTCVTSTQSSCSANLPQTDSYTTRVFSCTRNSNNRLPIGCLVEISCSGGSSFSSSIVDSIRTYICESTGLFRNIDTNTIVEFLTDTCWPYNSTSSTVQTTTTTSTPTVTTPTPSPSTPTVTSTTPSLPITTTTLPSSTSFITTTTIASSNSSTTTTTLTSSTTPTSTTTFNQQMKADQMSRAKSLVNVFLSAER